MLIVVPFTRWQNLSRLLEQWNAQTARADLLLVVNSYNGSAEAWSSTNERGTSTARMVVGPSSIGGARNRGFEWARARGDEWVLFLDDDNYHGPRLVEQVEAGIGPDVDALSPGIRFVRLDDGLHLFDYPFRMFPGHFTAARVSAAPLFPNSSGSEDQAWTDRRGGMVRSRQLPPWGFVYNRAGKDHQLAMSSAEFKHAFRPSRNFGNVPDSFADVPLPVRAAGVFT